MSAFAMSSKTQQIRVLLVEDNPADARLFREAIADTRRLPPLLTHVQRLDEAIEQLRTERFDVVLLDLSLPDSEGLDSIVRVHEKVPEIPIVILTGHDDEQLALQAVRAGAQDYLVKGQGDGNLLLRAMRYAIERKHIEEALQLREEHFRSLIENALDVITILSKEGVIRYESPAVARVLGYEPEDLEGQRIAPYVHPDDTPQLNRLLGGAGHDALTRSVEFRMRHRDGNWRTLEAIGKDFIDESGQPGVIVNSRDITSRRRAEEGLREAHATLRTVIETAPVAIYTVDCNRHVLSWNACAEKIFQWTADEIIGTPLPTIPPALAPESREQFERLCHGETLAAYETSRLRKDGTLIDVTIWTAPLRDAKGNIYGIMSTVADVTERKRLEDQLRQSQRMDAVGQLAGGIAHDFNNILTIIAGYSDLLLNVLDDETPLRRNIEEIKKASDRAAALTNQLLAFSRRQVLQARVLNLNAVILDVETMLDRLIGEDIELRLDLDQSLGNIKADAAQIEQVILNFVINAREAMPDGGSLVIGTKGITISGETGDPGLALAPGRYAVLSVTDTGTGMSAETAAHVFEPFFTTKPKGKGTGLGLSTAYGIVRQSGGEITIRSRVGEGTTFDVYLPIVDEAATVPTVSVIAAAPARGTETILLAEDEDTVRELLQEVLQNQGYSVLAASHGPEALELALNRSEPIDLLVTDLVMPHMNGRDLAERCTAAHPEMKVLYMSGYTDNTLVPGGTLTTGMEFIQKPFSPDDLARRIRQVLDSRKNS